MRGTPMGETLVSPALATCPCLGWSRQATYQVRMPRLVRHGRRWVSGPALCGQTQRASAGPLIGRRACRSASGRNEQTPHHGCSVSHLQAVDHTFDLQSVHLQWGRSKAVAGEYGNAYHERGWTPRQWPRASGPGRPLPPRAVCRSRRVQIACTPRPFCSQPSLHIHQSPHRIPSSPLYQAPPTSAPPPFQDRAPSLLPRSLSSSAAHASSLPTR